MAAIFEDDSVPEGTTQRRSRTEMVCDLMLAISKGAVRPTKIMQRANLTWNALQMYLYALVSNGLVWREERGTVSFYHLTEKGRRVLQAYTTLRQGLVELGLERMDTKAVAESMRVPSGAPPEAAEESALLERLRDEGYRMLPKRVKGNSGVTHEFGIVARDPRGAAHGYVFIPRPDDKDILGLFIKGLETGLKVHVIHRTEPGSLSAQRAREYGIEMMKIDRGGSAPRGQPGPRRDY